MSSGASAVTQCASASLLSVLQLAYIPFLANRTSPMSRAAGQCRHLLYSRPHNSLSACCLAPERTTLHSSSLPLGLISYDFWPQEVPSSTRHALRGLCRNETKALHVVSDTTPLTQSLAAVSLLQYPQLPIARAPEDVAVSLEIVRQAVRPFSIYRIFQASSFGGTNAML